VDLLDLAFDAILVRSFDDRVVTYWNRGAERLYGWRREDAVGRRTGDLLRSRYPAPIDEIERYLVEEGSWEGQVVQCRHDGGEVVVDARWALQRDAHGGPLAVLEISSDVTGERDAGRRLDASEEMFKLLVSSVLDYAIFLLDTGGRVVSWNEGAERIKGYRADQVLGRHFSIFYPPEEVRAGTPADALAAAARDGHFEAEGWRVRADGSRFWGNVVITALRDPTGELRAFAKVTRDLTERKLAQEQREAEQRREANELRERAEEMARLERTKSTFLNLASHELRAPLALVRGYVSMIEDGSLEVDEVRDIAPLLTARLTQMEALVQQMLETARLEDYRLQLKPEAVDLRELAEQHVAAHRLMARATHRMTVSVPDQPVMVRVDRARITTIVANLLDNAVKYSPRGGPIECVVAVSAGRAFLSVRDAGIGVARPDQARLFTRFGRIANDQTTGIPGTGLGLYLCREIALRHGGDITVESAPGRGSRFTLSLPLL